MDLDLRMTTESVRQKFLLFTKKCLEKQNSELGYFSEPEKTEIDFDSPDLEQAELQAKHFVERRRNGYRSLEIKENEPIRASIREWLKRTNRHRNL
jgi:hypothetical protein